MKFESSQCREAWYDVVSTLVNPKNTAENPFLKNKYAPLHEVLDYLKGEFLKSGFIIVQEAGYELGVCRVKTEFIHKEFGTACTEWCGTENKKDPQGTGSSITYLRRYQLLSVCGLVGEADDDGNRGAGKLSELEEAIKKCVTVTDLMTLYKASSKEEVKKYASKFTERKTEIEGGN